MMNWKKFIAKTQKLWARKDIYSDISGFQIQPHTKWNPGLSEEDITRFESTVGFPLPNQYREMLHNINGFDRDCIALDFDCEEEITYSSRRCYVMPDNWKEAFWLVEEILEFESFAIEALEGYPTQDIVGYIPIYGHRAVVAFKDPNLSPVISVWSDDIIIYGADLYEYLHKEFL